MDAERKAVLVDVGLGLLVFANGLLYVDPATVDYWWVAVAVAVSTAVAAWADDHGVVEGWTTVVGVALFGAALFVVALTAGPDLVSTVLPAILVGLGVGLVPYRCYYGLVRPIPEGRLAGVRERSV